MSEFDDLIGDAQDDSEVLIDLSEANDEFEPITPGKYAAIVKSCVKGVTGEKSKNPGAAKLVFKFAITEQGPFLKRVVSRHVVLSGKGAGIARDTIKALGFDTSGDKLRFAPSQSIGRACVIEVKAGDDPRYSEIDRVHPAA